eukprot:Seg1361.5 transcript_id=Seg1361.5/GoldUCD/mRNA.D3Y31 product="hypothetical protein" protein_id=Seg1361.5/GoldUCD/D3Y31
MKWLLVLLFGIIAGSYASPAPVDDFEEDAVEELNDQDEEEGQSDLEEADSQPENEIIREDTDNDDDEAKDSENDPRPRLHCGIGLYVHCTITRKCGPWGWRSCRNHKTCKCQCMKQYRYYRHCYKPWGIFKRKCIYQQRHVCRKASCPRRRTVAGKIYCG